MILRSASDKKVVNLEMQHKMLIVWLIANLLTKKVLSKLSKPKKIEDDDDVKSVCLGFCCQK